MVSLVMSIIALIFTIVQLDPYTKTWYPVLFYLDIFVLIFTLTFLLGYFLRQRFGIREFANKNLQIASRQSLSFGLLVVVSLILSANGLFNLWNAAFLILSFAFLESYFLSK